MVSGKETITDITRAGNHDARLFHLVLCNVENFRCLLHQGGNRLVGQDNRASVSRAVAQSILCHWELEQWQSLIVNETRNLAWNVQSQRQAKSGRGSGPSKPKGSKDRQRLWGSAPSDPSFHSGSPWLHQRECHRGRAPISNGLIQDDWITKRKSRRILAQDLVHLAAWTSCQSLRSWTFCLQRRRPSAQLGSFYDCQEGDLPR